MRRPITAPIPSQSMLHLAKVMRRVYLANHQDQRQRRIVPMLLEKIRLLVKRLENLS